MDPRVGQLVADIQYAASIDGGVDAVGLRNAIVDLFNDVEAEDDRVALIETFHAVTDTAARELVSEGRSTTGLEAARHSQQRMFCIHEATIDGKSDARRLAQVVAREVAAGRMDAGDSFVQQVRADRQKLVSDARPAAPRVRPQPAKGWWPRTFGA